MDWNWELNAHQGVLSALVLIVILWDTQISRKIALHHVGLLQHIYSIPHTVQWTHTQRSMDDLHRSTTCFAGVYPERLHVLWKSDMDLQFICFWEQQYQIHRLFTKRMFQYSSLITPCLGLKHVWSRISDSTFIHQSGRCPEIYLSNNGLEPWNSTA